MKTPAKKAAKKTAPQSKAKAVGSAKASVAKGTAKVAVKVPAKAVAAPAKRQPVPVKKASPKPATKALTKALTKGAVKPAAVAKPAQKALQAGVKPSVKAPAKSPAKPVVKPAGKPVAKVVVKAVVKAIAQPVSKAKSVAKAVPAKASPTTTASPKVVPTPKKPTTVSKPSAVSTKKEAVKKVESDPIPVSKAPPVVAEAPAPDQPVRSSRPSARLAQITVPSLPPAVASTAAKASYLPGKPEPVVTVPLFVVKKDAKLANNWKSKTADQLTDAEILAMPDAEYMGTLQMAYFRRKLVILKTEMLANAGQTTEHLREDTVVVPDPADRATIEEEHALELRTRDRERKLLKKIEQSIMLIDAGDYGYCDETGEPIGVGRLLARPTATLSLEAQQRRELKQKMFGD